MILNKPKTLIDNIHYGLLIVLILTMPYYISNSWIGTLSIFIFLLAIINNKINLKSFLSKKPIVFLMLFIAMSYFSLLWSENPLTPLSALKDFNEFKYYILIIPGIYFSNLSQARLFFLFKVIAISPLAYIIIYYLNASGLTSIYSTHYYPETGYIALYVDLIANIYIYLSALYLYIKLFSSIHTKNKPKVLLYLVLFIFVSISLFIDPTTSSRTINLAFFLFLLAVPLYFFKAYIKFIIPISLILFSLTVYLLINSSSFKTGVDELKLAIEKNSYSGSWGYRAGLMVVGYEIFKTSPILGNGNNVKTITLQIREKKPYLFAHHPLIHFHNEHIVILTKIGIVGYILFLIFLFYLFKLKLSSPEINTYKNIFILSLFIFFFGEQYFTFKATTNAIAVLIALFILQDKTTKKETTHA